MNEEIDIIIDKMESNGDTFAASIIRSKLKRLSYLEQSFALMRVGKYQQGACVDCTYWKRKNNGTWGICKLADTKGFHTSVFRGTSRGKTLAKGRKKIIHTNIETCRYFSCIMFCPNEKNND